MKNTLGSNMQITLFGESHGPFIGVVLDGLAPGMAVDGSSIKAFLDRRRPSGVISTSRVETDAYEIVSGVFDGRTTGTPLCLLIPNSDADGKDYSGLAYVARPGHADYAAQCKYHGFQDYRGGGHFSGRLTAALVAAAGVVMPALRAKGIAVGTHIKLCSGVADQAFSADACVLSEQIARLNAMAFPVLGDKVEASMRAEIEKALLEGDSVGGVLETAVTGLPSGLGEPWFDSMESVLSHALFSIPAVKGVQFGAGFDLVCGRGSAFNDAFRLSEGRVVTGTNNNGGVNGGITNGMPVVFSCAVKPTPSIRREQSTVDFKSGSEVRLSIEGRHDPAIVHRASAVVDGITALVLYDILIGRFGTDFFCNVG